MRAKDSIVALAAFLAFLPAAGAIGSEKKVKKSDLPLAVQKTVDAQSKGATVRNLASENEGGSLQYEVELIVDGHSRDVAIATDGSVLEIEEEVAWDALPAHVRTALEKKAGGRKITKVESITKHGKLVAYEAQVGAGTKRSEIQVGPDGDSLTHEE